MNQKQVITGLIIVAIAVIIGYALITLTCENQSRQKLDQCNTDCGEGLLSELCKTGCTIEHNQRLGQCAKQ
jgi:hypothetical protein